MRSPRVLVAIPAALAHRIERLGGNSRRTEFIVDVIEQELLRREQLSALQAAAGSWLDQDHPELAEGGAAHVEKLRRLDAPRYKHLVASQD